jgi:hypothetical protein
MSTFNSVDNTAGSDDIDRVNFGYRNASDDGAVVGYVWNDRDGGGDWDATEEPIAGVTVYLCADTGDCDSATNLGSTTTDENGFYSFTAAPGDYRIGVETADLPGMSQSGDPDGPGANCSAAPGGCDSLTTTAFTISAHEVEGAYNFGYDGGLTIGDTVYADWNGDGDQGSGEEGIGGVQVYLYRDVDGDGEVDAGVDTLLDTQTTNGSGVYQFDGLAGNGNEYIVVVNEADLPTGYTTQTGDPEETGGACSVCDGQGEVTLLAASVDTADFGYQPRGQGSIGDLVWADTNGDGVKDTSESGVDGVSVNLYQDENGDGTIDAEDALVDTTTTAGGGIYAFSNLLAGNYIVEIASSNFSGGQPLDGLTMSTSGAAYDGDQVSYQVALGDGEDFEDADFGFSSSAIGDRIWQDNDGDGTEDTSEPGISGVLVRLIDCGADLACGSGGDDVQIATDTTDSDGYYEFTGLPAGDYQVIVDASNFNPGQPLDDFTLTYDPDAYSTNSSKPFPPCDPSDGDYVNCDGTSTLDNSATAQNPTPQPGLQLGRVDRSHDFGYEPAVAIGDRVWLDTNNDDTPDAGEVGLSGVVITLTLEAGGTMTTTTDSDGYYSFGNIPDGNHSVEVDTGTLPAGVAPTYDYDGGDDHQAAFTISGASNWDLDFAYQFSGSNSVSGTVFHDDNDNATQDGGETTSYEGVTLYLWHCGDDDTCGSGGDDLRIATTTTDASGNYSFSGLPDARYVVAVHAGAPTLTGLDPTVTSSPTTNREVDLDSDENDPPISLGDQDFGFLSQVDMGDLPSSYGITTLSDDGARHIVPTSGAVYLGSAPPDTEADGQESSDATGDGADENDNGVVRTPGVSWSPVSDGGSIDVTINGCSGTCYLSGWIDWGNDDSLSEAGDRILLDRPVSDGARTITFDIPGSATINNNSFFARFRLYSASTSGRALPTGLVNNGEVEDYQWSFGSTAVDLASFVATAQDTGVLITWTTATEIDLLGFNLYRAESFAGAWIQVNEDLIPSQASGGPVGANYQFVDGFVEPGMIYYYWLEAVSSSGKVTHHGPVSVQVPDAAPEMPYRTFLPMIRR